MTKELTGYEKTLLVLVGALPLSIFICILFLVIIAIVTIILVGVVGILNGILISLAVLIIFGGGLFAVFFAVLLILDLVLLPFKLVYDKFKAKKETKTG